VPTYGYHCPRCQTEFEVLQRMTDDAAADCPHCGTPGRRLFFPAGIVFKGSGFYKTDSRRASTAAVNGGAPSSGGKAAGDSSGGKTAGDSNGGGGQKPAAGDRTATRDQTTSGEKTSGGGGATTRSDVTAGGSAGT